MNTLLTSLRKLPAPGPQDLAVAARAPELKVTLLIPARNSAHSLESTAETAHRHFRERYGDSFEIILIPNSDLNKPGDGSLEVAEALAAKFPQVKVCRHTGVVGKGAALRSGFFQSRGEMIFFTDADLPYSLDFFDEAARHLQSGIDFVTGNRRLAGSRANIPSTLQQFAQKRRSLGMAFNRAVQLLLPVGTTDTQAGIKALSRRFANEAFALQACPGFFFDLEMFLTQNAGSYRHRELPVTLCLTSEKTTVSLARELILSGFWLTRIALRNLLGRYRVAETATEAPAALDTPEGESG